MAAEFTRNNIKISVAKILQTLGWHSINTTPLEVMTDILSNFISELGRNTNEYANEFGYTEPNLDHLGMAFREMGVSLGELEEYVTNVNFGPPPSEVPKYPLPRDNHMNFLKPGSKEVVTRPVYIHEHLPPMYPLLEGPENESETVVTAKLEPEEGEIKSETVQIFKKPADVSPVEFRRINKREEETSRPTREISSVMMTTSGFLSPAREGKLPDARTPIQPPTPERTPPHSPNEPELVQPITKPPPKKNERKKEKINKELFKPISEDKPVVKKSATPREPKPKHPKANGNQNTAPGLFHDKPLTSKQAQNKVNRTLAAARLKTEKLNTTITPIPMPKTEPPLILPTPPPSNLIGKLFTEPDKKKVNIFKKISNVKNEPKVKSREEAPKSRGSSPDLIIDEPDELVNKMNLPSDITIEPIQPTYSKSPEKIEPCYFDDNSLPGTPSTPKTPELITQSPPNPREKRKRKDSKRVRKIPKMQHPLDSDLPDMTMERPKTPEMMVKPLPRARMEIPTVVPPQMPFPFHFGGPGLIPAPIPNGMFPFLPFPNGPFSPVNPMAMSGLRPQHPLHNFMHPPRMEEPVVNPEPSCSTSIVINNSPTAAKPDKKAKEHKKEKKDKLKKKNKKDKLKNKEAKKKQKEEKKEKIKKEKREKKKEKEPKEDDVNSSTVPKLFLKLGSPSPRPETPETIKKLNIKPIVKKEEPSTLMAGEQRRETSPGLAKISALVTGPPKPKNTTAPAAEELVADQEIATTSAPAPRNGPGPGRPRIHPIKTKPTSAPKPKKRRTASKTDADGVEVWICPGCHRQDDGSPMIGCDDCDAWYHWVCVGIQVPPDENVDWYCRHCLMKKNEDLQSDKKKKRKKREKKEH